MNHCNVAFWTVRWRSLDPNVTVIAFRAPYDADTTTYPMDAFGPLPEPATAGYFSGYICERPAFAPAEASNAAALVDVAVEWQYWDAAP